MTFSKIFPYVGEDLLIFPFYISSLLDDPIYIAGTCFGLLVKRVLWRSFGFAGRACAATKMRSNMIQLFFGPIISSTYPLSQPIWMLWALPARFL